MAYFVIYGVSSSFSKCLLSNNTTIIFSATQDNEALKHLNKLLLHYEMTLS